MMKELLTIQQSLKAPKDKFNSHGSFKYRSCESILQAVKPILRELNCTLLLSDSVNAVGNAIFVTATATLTNETGEQVIVTGFALHDLARKGMDGAQITGAASSYARKYALNGLFAIDDTKDPDTDEWDKQKEAAEKQYNANVQALIQMINACVGTDELFGLYNANAAYQSDQNVMNAFSARKAAILQGL